MRIEQGLQLIDPPYDYRDDLGGEQIEACLAHEIGNKNWRAAEYWVRLLINRDRRDKQLPPI